MAITLKQNESAPSSYPAAPAGLSTAAAVYADVAWARVESYTAYRYTSRNVSWIAEGVGEWVPPLSPATITKVEIWADGGWSDVTPDASPLGGYWLPSRGPYRFSGTVGGGTVPDVVNEAVRRLAEYISEIPGAGGASSERVDITDIESQSISRTPTWMAKALTNSGAADLLRGYRNV